jgi:catechol 2,3-dioxygenase-like lactoylglutathione lyase family enzyme
VQLRTLDHVALWVADRSAVVARALDELDVRVVEKTDRFTLLGADARRGKLTFFSAEGPREQGALVRIGLRVSSLDGRPRGVDLGEGLEIALVEAPTDVDYDLDHVVLRSRDPEATVRAYEDYGFGAAPPGGSGLPRVGVGDAAIEFERGDPGDPERPLLNHLGVLVGSVDEHRDEAEAAGIEIADEVDAANTRALFVWLPERVKLEYIEHKPEFSLR